MSHVYLDVTQTHFSKVLKWNIQSLAKYQKDKLLLVLVLIILLNLVILK